MARTLTPGAVAAASTSARSSAIAIDTIVPPDPWAMVRAMGFTIYAVGYVVWFLTKGMIIDRISVAISVGIFVVIGHLGRCWRHWARLLIGAVAYTVMWFIYEQTRGWGDRAGFALQVEAPRNIDRFLFFGTDPNVWMQNRFYDAKIIHWYDKVASAIYYTHFILPVIALAILWVTSHRQWVRFMTRFATMLLVACVGFVLTPTVPPWMAADKKYDYQILEPLARHTGRGFRAMGLKGFVKVWQSSLEWGNPVAAMPSLHAAFALFVPAFFLPWIRPIWLKGLVLTFPLLMLASLVYFGEHYVADAVAGWLLVAGSFALWGWIDRRAVRRRAAHATDALVILP